MGRIAKILGLITIVALLLGGGALFQVVAQEAVTVSVDAPADVDADSDFTANVDITNVTDFDACQYDVTFDDSVLQLDSVTLGQIGSTNIPVDLYNEISPGTYRVIQNVPGITGVSGSGYLAVLHFHVIGSEGSSSAIDLSGGVLSDIEAQSIPANWVGDTVSVSDFTAPTVSSTSPAADAVGIAVGTVVTATFSEAMDSSTITTSSFTLDSVSGTVSYNSGTYTATFTPDADLAYETTYTATLSTAITDVAGNPLASAYSWSFTTASVGGVVVSIDAPAEVDADSDFTADVDITEVTDFDACQYDVTFNDSVLQLDSVTLGQIGSTNIPVDLYNEISPGTYRVIQNVPGITGVSGSGYLAVLHFHVIGSEGTSSPISLSGGILSDIEAQSIPATWIGDSVTVPGVDTTPPTVVSTSPVADAVDVAVDTVVTATFSEAMDESTITTSSFTLKIGATPVSGTVSYNSGTYTATFTPDANLSHSTTYTATLSMAITDVAGNPLASAYSWSFTTASVEGVVVSIDAPAGVNVDSDFTADVDITEVTDFDACQYDVTFDDSVLRLDSVTSGQIGSTEIPVDIYNQIGSGTYRVVQNVPGLSGVSGSGYLAVLHFHVIGSNGDSSPISLSSGMLSNILAEQIPATWVGGSVLVGPGGDVTPPTVVSTSPAADAVDVAVDTVVTATFSEAMDESTITTSSFTLEGMSGSVSYNSGTYTATFTPIVGLAYDTTYTANLSTDITDDAGNHLASAYSWSFTTIPAGAVVVSIDAPDGPRAGSNFTADVVISDVTDFDACQYDVTFDDSVLRLDDVTSGQIGSIEIPVDIYNEIGPGTYRVVQNVPGLTGATGSGYLAVLNFYAAGSPDDISAIELSNGTLSNIQAEEIPAVWVGDAVTLTRRPGGGGGGGGGGGAPPDTTSPAISGVGASNITKTSADIGWKTDEPSDSQVDYWASPGTLTPLDTAMVTEHTVHLDELNPGSTYYFKTRSTDEAGNLAVSEEHTFTTLAEAAAFTSSELSISPSAVYVGETVTISVSIANNGDAAGSFMVTLKIDGVVEGTKEITLNAGTSGEVTFTTAKDVAGTYSVEIDGLSGSFIVEEKPETTPPPSEAPPEEPGVKWPVIWGVMGGVLIVGVIIFWIFMRRRAY